MGLRGRGLGEETRQLKKEDHHCCSLDLLPIQSLFGAVEAKDQIGEEVGFFGSLEKIQISEEEVDLSLGQALILHLLHIHNLLQKLDFALQSSQLSGILFPQSDLLGDVEGSLLRRLSEGRDQLERLISGLGLGEFLSSEDHGGNGTLRGSIPHY